MKRLKIKELEPGMILVEDVYRNNRDLLLKRGVVLTNEMIGQLGRFKVKAVMIQGDDNYSPPELDPEIAGKTEEEIEKNLNLKFEKVAHNPLMLELKKIFLQYLMNERVK